MKQISLMNDLDDPLTILSKDGEVTYHKNFYAESESKQLFEELLNGLNWQCDELVMFGKKVTTSRKVVWVADEDLSYTYSGVKKNPQEWSTPLLGIKQKLESFCGHQFNSCLLNLYHHGDEGMGWHSKGAVTILMYVMIAGVGGLILLRLKKLSRRRFIEAPI